MNAATRAIVGAHMMVVQLDGLLSAPFLLPTCTRRSSPYTAESLHRRILQQGERVVVVEVDNEACPIGMSGANEHLVLRKEGGSNICLYVSLLSDPPLRIISQTYRGVGPKCPFIEICEHNVPSTRVP